MRWVSTGRSAALGIILCAAAPVAMAQSEHGEICSQVFYSLCGEGQLADCLGRDEALWNQIPTECMADAQTAVETAREAREQEQTEIRDKDGGGSGLGSGRSYGGKLRAGPGQEFAQIGSLKEGDPVELIEDTGVSDNDYVWFRIRSKKGEGYQWGGILCSADRTVAGVYQMCE